MSLAGTLTYFIELVLQNLWHDLKLMSSNAVSKQKNITLIFTNVNKFVIPFHY